jgi:hypothetical protein
VTNVCGNPYESGSESKRQVLLRFRSDPAGYPENLDSFCRPRKASGVVGSQSSPKSANRSRYGVLGALFLFPSPRCGGTVFPLFHNVGLPYSGFSSGSQDMVVRTYKRSPSKPSGWPSEPRARRRLVPSKPRGLFGAWNNPRQRRGALCASFRHIQGRKLVSPEARLYDPDIPVVFLYSARGLVDFTNTNLVATLQAGKRASGCVLGSRLTRA